MQKFDVLIVGGGMVGLTLALSLRKTNKLTVAIVDTLPVTDLPEQPEIRVSAINLASKAIFENLGVWPAIEASRLQGYQHMHVWDKAGVGKLDFSHQDVDSFPTSDSQGQQLGWIIENSVIRNALWQQAQQDEGISFFTDSKLANLAVGDSEVFASFENNSQPIMAKLVVGADGANSWVRKQMDMAMVFQDYDHHAIVATVKCPQGHQNTAWQVFLSTGPLAFLPLASKHEGEDLCSIVYSTAPDDAKRLLELDADDFAKELTAASDGKLGAISLMSERAAYPLTMRLAQDFVKERVILVGDAAHTIHPLAGQGVNLGLLDAAALAQTLQPELVDAVAESDSLYDVKTLKAFARWRKAEASEMITAMAAIKQAFTPQQAGFKALRGLGMNIINQLPFAKKHLIAQALGLKDGLPSLAYSKK